MVHQPFFSLKYLSFFVRHPLLHYNKLLFKIIPNLIQTSDPILAFIINLPIILSNKVSNNCNILLYLFLLHGLYNTFFIHAISSHLHLIVSELLHSLKGVLVALVHLRLELVDQHVLLIDERFSLVTLV